MNNKELLYKKLNCLRLEVDGSIVDDIKSTVDALFQEQNLQQTDVRGSFHFLVEELNAIKADICHILKSIDLSENHKTTRQNILEKIENLNNNKPIVNNTFIVIHEKDNNDNENTVIGVADSVINAQKIIDKYYGKYEELSFTDIRDRNLEWSKVLKFEGAYNKSYTVVVTLEWFELNC